MNLRKSWIVLVFVLRWAAATLRLPLGLGPAEVNINLPRPVGQILGTIFNANKKGGGNVPQNFQHSIGPLSVNVNFQPMRNQAYQQYTPENYQFMPPAPAMTQQSQSYYQPYGQANNQYRPQAGYYGPGYYSAGPQIQESGYYPVGPQIQESQQPPQHPHLPNQPHQYCCFHPGYTVNPYMRPAYPSGPIVPMNTNTQVPPLHPNKNANKSPNRYDSVKKGTIVMPDSPLYVHIPEEPPTMAFQPR